MTNINDLLIIPNEMSKDYKLSKYNICIKPMIIANTRTMAICELESYELSIDNLQDLLDCGFIVDKQCDELVELENEYNHRDSYSNELHLIIATTLDCQFRCLYCYEEHPKKYMSSNVKESIIKVIKDAAEKGNNISIVWYGGEPMLDFTTIEEMSQKIIEICGKNNVSYNATMISNGLAFDEEKIAKLDSLSISSIQITVDGMKEMHEARRPLGNGNASFDKIISNILKINQNTGVEVHLRINVDKDNIRSAYELIDYCTKLGLSGIDVNLGMMKKFGCDHACGSSDTNLFSMKEFADEFLSFRDYLKDKGFMHAIEKMQPEYKLNSCTMDAPNSYVIDPDGFVYKCISKVGQMEASIGNVTTNFDKYAHNKISPFNSSICSSCKYFPICKGGCLMNNISEHRECNIWKFITEKLLEREL